MTQEEKIAHLKEFYPALPDGLEIDGALDLSGCTGLKSLPDGLKVGESLYLYGCRGLTALPDGLEVGTQIFKDF